VDNPFATNRFKQLFGNEANNEQRGFGRCAFNGFQVMSGLCLYGRIGKGFTG
jgi:hypothetical protein